MPAGGRRCRSTAGPVATTGSDRTLAMGRVRLRSAAACSWRSHVRLGGCSSGWNLLCCAVLAAQLLWRCTQLEQSLTSFDPSAGYQEYRSESYSVIGVPPPGRCGMMHAPPPSALHMDPLSSLGLLLVAALAGELLY